MRFASTQTNGRYLTNFGKANFLSNYDVTTMDLNLKFKPRPFQILNDCYISVNFEFITEVLD